MVDDSEYQWAEIEKGARGVELPMRHYPWIEKAIASQGTPTNPDWSGETVTAICRNLLQLRALRFGDDD